MKTAASKLNWKGKIVRTITRERAWFRIGRLLESHAQYIKGSVIDAGGGRGKYKEQILAMAGVKDYTNLDLLETADIVTDLNAPLRIDDNRYDTALCIGVLYYLKEPQVALNEINRILKPSSYLLLYVPWMSPTYSDSVDYFRFSDAGITYLLEKAGFQVEKIISLGGKKLTLFTFLRKWVKWTGAIRPFIDKLLASKSEVREKDAIGYFAVARKL